MKKLNEPLIRLELEEWGRGVKYIGGVDEVGRGCLAGPMVVACVVLNSAHFHQENSIKPEYSKITDSKLLTPSQREALNSFILENAVSTSIVEIQSSELDRLGITKSTDTAFFESVQYLKVKPQTVFTDAFKITKLSATQQKNFVKGDRISISIAAASIVAKVYRDNLMRLKHLEYPQYGFDKHKGYGTKQHLEAIKAHGICAIHRTSFEPIKSLLKTTSFKDLHQSDTI